MGCPALKCGLVVASLRLRSKACKDANRDEKHKVKLKGNQNSMGCGGRNALLGMYNELPAHLFHDHDKCLDQQSVKSTQPPK